MDFREKAIEILKGKEALVFCGGGVLGIAECGALIALEELGVNMKNFKSVTGSSVGSILSSVIASDGTTEYMKKMLDTMEFSKFQDNDCFLVSFIQLITKYGLNKTTEIKNLATTLLKELTQNENITFKQLYDKTGVHLTITYLSLNYKATLYADYLTEPDSSVKEAIIKSSAIPLFYEAHVEGKGKGKQISCDGGTLDNFPMGVPRKKGIDPNKILGLKLIASAEILHEDNGGPGIPLQDNGAPPKALKYFLDIVDIMRKQALRLHVSKNDWMLSIKINVGTLSSTSFTLTKEEKEWLFNQGKQAVHNYVDELAGLLESGTYPY